MSSRMQAVLKNQLRQVSLASSETSSATKAGPRGLAPGASAALFLMRTKTSSAKESSTSVSITNMEG